MKVLMIIVVLLALMCRTGSAADCGNKCQTGEVCFKKTGTCVDRSELVFCDAFTYCMKGQKCCIFGCVPENAVCCGWYSCKTGTTCCGSMLCCLPGYSCYNGKCTDNDDIIWTTRPVTTTKKPFTTKSMSTTKSTRRTRWPLKTYPKKRTTFDYRKASSSTNLFLWWHAVIIAAVFIAAVAVVSLFLRKCTIARKNGSTASSCGRVLSVPAQANQPKPTGVESNFINTGYSADGNAKANYK